MSGIRYAAAVALVALAGCSAHGGSGAKASSSANAQDASVKFAQCMRQHGVNVADPRPGDPGIRITGKDMNQSQLDAAMSACRKYDPKGDINPNDPRVRDQMLKTAQCLRRHGVQIADPQPGQGLRIQMKKDDTKMRQAMEACRKLVPPPTSSPAGHGG